MEFEGFSSMGCVGAALRQGILVAGCAFTALLFWLWSIFRLGCELIVKAGQLWLTVLPNRTAELHCLAARCRGCGIVGKDWSRRHTGRVWGAG
jgi:hypothetical protein